MQGVGRWEPDARGRLELARHRIYSVGYEGLTVRGLVDMLKADRVSLVVDVRLNAVSRRPGWSKRALSTELEAAGIAYRHEPTLGNPPENRDAFRRGDSQAGSRRMRELLTDGSHSAIEHLVEDARSRPVAVLCVERASLHCHRRVITDIARELDPDIDVIDVL